MSRSQPLRINVFRVLAACVLIGLGASSYGQVTSSSHQVGGMDAPACGSMANPPTLENGTPASGQLDYSYNAATMVLTLTAYNTSPVTTGVVNPVITRVYANLPATAIAGATLLSQMGSGGAVPNWSLAVDTNNLDGTGSIFGSCFGKFGILLQIPGGIANGIANPLADTIPGPLGSMVIGPVTFHIQLALTTTAATGLIAESFANSRSANPPGSQQANCAFKLQTIEDDGGYLGNAPAAGGGSPAAWFVGEMMGGQTVQAFYSGTPAWEGCLVASLTPGPININGITFPIGADWFPIFGGILPPSGILFTNVMIPTTPPLPEIATLTFYAIVVLASPDHRTISVSEQFTLSVVF